MLGRPVHSVEEVLKRIEKRPCTIEYKYDGERAQIHYTDNKAYIYSRNQENNTQKYPDIVEFLPKCLQSNIKSIIFDAEVVAWDINDKKVLPFQTQSTRKRKDVKQEDIKVYIVLFVFDILYVNGINYMRYQLEKRREILYNSIKQVDNTLYYATHYNTNDPDEIQEFLQKAVDNSCEGQMIKPQQGGAAYVPGKRNWLKLKKDYLDTIGDTLDLIPLGAWYGKGKRTGQYGAFLMFCISYDNDGEYTFQSMLRLGSGFKENELEELSSLLYEYIIEVPPNYYQYSTVKKTLTPDVWFCPKFVWEVKCADFTLSPDHRTGIGLIHPTSGISGRFPRFISVRKDKNITDATSAEQIHQMYLSQNTIQKQEQDSDIDE